MALDDIIGNSTSNVFIRPSLFMVSTTCTGMNDIAASQDIGGGLLIKSTTLPGTSIGTVEVPYRGRKAYLPTHRQLPGDISLSIMYHKDQDWHNEFTAWMDLLQPAAGTSISSLDVNDNTMTIESRDPATNAPFHTYTLFGCIPTSIGAAELSAESAESLLEFTINIQYTYHTVTG
jgi:hypothetical protein|tara:strand:- start:2770 stop:3297 length:528 start_codon:yes stop_codon:yes gene_type:complete